MTDKNRRTALDSAALVAEPGTPAAEVIETAEAFLRWLEPPAVKADTRPRGLTVTNAFALGGGSVAERDTRARGAAKTAGNAWATCFDETHLFKPGASFDEWIYTGPPLKPGGIVGKPADRPERVIPLPLPKRDPETGADVQPSKYRYFRGRGRLYRVVTLAGYDAPAEYWYGPSSQWASAAVWSKFSSLFESPQFTEVRF